MTIDPETLMAYADGELDPLGMKRVERAIAADPALADEIARHRALRDRLAAAFAPVAAAPVPDRLAALVRDAGLHDAGGARDNVVALPKRARAPLLAGWRGGAAIAASLVLGVTAGMVAQRGPVTAQGGALYASSGLARALDEQTAGGEGGAVRVAVSFRDGAGVYCRVFAAPVTDGIACRDGVGWRLRRTMEGAGQGAGAAATGGYAQAGSTDAALMVAAQEMMAGEPLDAAGERAARARGWR